MSHAYGATVSWERGGQNFLDRKFSRAHVWRFDGGVEAAASSSPLVVKPPLSREDAVDPEEALVASVSSCHMLFFLDLAARMGFRIDSYRDAAAGMLGKRPDGRTAMVSIVLKPEIVFSGEARPGAEEIADLHHRAHALCYISNSLNFEVEVQAQEAKFV
jgi:organic hydroperoxide reductase OsmC/OhrA